MSATIDTILALFPDAKPAGPGKWKARCSAHQDTNPSLSIAVGDDGRILLHCFAGCTVDAICARRGIQVADLFPPKAGDSSLKARWKHLTYSTFEAATAAIARKVRGQYVASWTYHNADGSECFRVLRFNLPDGSKQFRPVYFNGTRWVVGDPPGPLPLYGLHLLDGARRINAFEGERKCEAARSVGLTPTTSAHGAKSAHKTDWKPLAGREVAIWPDTDEAGERYAAEVAAILTKLAPPATVRIVRLPGLQPDSGEDIVDWLAPDGPAGDKSAEEARQWIESLADAAPLWTPGAVAETPEFSGDCEVSATATSSASVDYCPFPTDVLPEPLRSFVAQAAEAIGCDSAFLALPLLAAAASAIGNTRRIELKRGWAEPAILWAAIIGESGSLKSPALELVLRPIRRRQQKAMKSYAKEMEAYNVELLRYEVELNAWKKKSKGEWEPPEKPKEPACPRCWCDDTTIEKLAILLLENWRGLLMARDELAAWFGGFDRYAQVKGNDAPKWLEMHGGRSIMVDRKTGNPRTIHVPRAAVSVTGGIQPATLQRVLGRAYFENGLAARLLLAYPPRRVKEWTEKEVDRAVEDAVAGMFDRLFSLEPITDDDGDLAPVIVGLSPAAKSAWVDFFNEHAHEQVDLTGDLSAAWSKLEGYAARLALVVHLIRWSADDATLTNVDVVDETSVAAGVRLSRWFGDETRRVYAILQETDDDHERQDLVELIQRHGGSITAHDLARVSRSHRPSDVAEQSLTSLVKAGLGRWKETGTNAQGGRPTLRFVLTAGVAVAETLKTPENSGVSATPTGGAA